MKPLSRLAIESTPKLIIHPLQNSFLYYQQIYNYCPPFLPPTSTCRQGRPFMAHYSNFAVQQLGWYFNNCMSEKDVVESCQLVGFAGIMIQITLAALSFSVLIYKRYIQKPKRAWRIWAMDTSKQAVSQMLAHIINVVISMQLSSLLSGDACIWYFTTNILDNTVGVLLCVTVLGLIEKYLFWPSYTRFQSGNYYTVSQSFEEDRSFVTPTTLDCPQSTLISKPLLTPLQITSKKTFYTISYFDWFIQFVIWNSIVIFSKSLMFELEVLLNVPLISVSTFLIGWIQPYQTFELVLVIIIVPVIMNGFAFWFQDNFLKKKESQPETELPPTVQVQTKKEDARKTVAQSESATESVPKQLPESQPRPDLNNLLL